MLSPSSGVSGSRGGRESTALAKSQSSESFLCMNEHPYNESPWYGKRIERQRENISDLLSDNYSREFLKNLKINQNT